MAAAETNAHAKASYPRETETEIDRTALEVVAELIAEQVGTDPDGKMIQAHAWRFINRINNAGYRIVADQPGHFVTFDDQGWFIEHSLDCRIAGTIGTCGYNEAIRENFDTGHDLRQVHGRWLITNIDSEGAPSLERADR